LALEMYRETLPCATDGDDWTDIPYQPQPYYGCWCRSIMYKSEQTLEVNHEILMGHDTLLATFCFMLLQSPHR